MRISSWLYRVSSGLVTIGAVVIFFAFTAVVLPAQAEQAERFSSGAGSPDTQFFYTPEWLYQTADLYGEAGRQAYIVQRFTFDVVWPLVYAAFLVTTISWLYKRILPEGIPWRLLNLLPLAGFACDFLENFSTSFVMLRYPQPAPLAAWLAPAFTLFKWVFIGSSFAILVVGFFLWLGKRLVHRASQGENA